MPPKTKITLSEAQKYELCLYARGNEKTRTEYVNWVENKWGVRVNESQYDAAQISILCNVKINKLQ